MALIHRQVKLIVSEVDRGPRIMKIRIEGKLCIISRDNLIRKGVKISERAFDFLGTLRKTETCHLLI